MSQPPLLGDLEAATMELFWSTSGGFSVKDVHAAVGVSRGVTLNTIQSTVKRLFEKGLLSRHKISHAYIYEAQQTRADFQRQVLEEVVGMLSGEPDGAVLSAFVDLTERAGRDRLELLEALVTARLAAEEEEGS